MNINTVTMKQSSLSSLMLDNGIFQLDLDDKINDCNNEKEEGNLSEVSTSIETKKRNGIQRTLTTRPEDPLLTSLVDDKKKKDRLTLEETKPIQFPTHYESTNVLDDGSTSFPSSTTTTSQDDESSSDNGDEIITDIDEEKYQGGSYELNKENRPIIPQFIELTSYVDPEKLEEKPEGKKGFRNAIGPEDFELCRVLGKGSFGKVFLVRKMTGCDKGTLFAMKVLKKANIILHRKDTEHMKTERSILEEVRHPFIVKLVYAFQTREKLYLIMEFASGGELYTYLDKEGMFLEDTVRFYAAELILAIGHLHEVGIIYRDLKPENILLDREGHVILTDFGLSKMGLGRASGSSSIGEQSSSTDCDGRTNTFCGTIEYMAPEILCRDYYDKRVDWWSLGILMYDMLVGKTPFVSASRHQTIERIKHGKLKLPSYLTYECQDIIKKLLKKSPDQRLGNGGVMEIKSHLFFRTINWNHLLSKELPPKIRPTILTEGDVNNFASMFTSMPVVDTPVDYHHHTLDDSWDMFAGFSYVNSNMLGHHSSHHTTCITENDNRRSSSSPPITISYQHPIL